MISDAASSRSSMFQMSSEDMEATRAQFEAVVRDLADGIVIVDSDGIVRFHNPAAEQLYGVRAGGLLGSFFGIASVSSRGAEVEILGSQGTRRVAELRASTVNWNRKKCQLLSIRDITEHIHTKEELRKAKQLLQDRVSQRTEELRATLVDLKRETTGRKRTEAELIDSEERFRLAFEHGPLGKAIVDADMRLLNVNYGLQEMLRYSTSELVRCRLTDIMHIDDANANQELFEALFAGNILQHAFEARLLTKDGHVVISRITMSRAHSRESGETIGIVMFENITSLRKAQEASRRHERMVAIGTLAAGVAHEINNPVGAALLAAETAITLLPEKGISPIVRQALDNIVLGMERCGQIIRNTLRFSQQSDCDRALCDVNRIVRQCRDLVNATSERRGATIDLHLEEQLPPMFANELEIQLTILNIIQNSVQAGDNITVKVSTRCMGQDVEITIADNGPGLTDEQRQHLFDPFFTTRRQEGGTGLGLSIAYGIVEDNDGTIEIESELGKGTKTQIVLPLWKSETDISDLNNHGRPD
ncbi:PAS domain S-box protein [bacterium]|nr:PAS domain S-box protein [bacterium]